MTSSRVHSSRDLQREPLSTGWEFCATEPNAATAPQALSEPSLEWLPASVPCTAASALRSLGSWSFDSPARDFNAQDWWFRTRFHCADLSRREPLLLHFAGLATVADVWLNGELVLRSDNMFRAYEVDVSTRVKADNELVIHFPSLNALLKAKRPRPRWKVPMLVDQQLRWFRTTLLGRTPGWSPPAAAVGPWREIYLERRASQGFRNVRWQASITEGNGVVRVSGEFAPLPNTPPLQCVVRLTRKEKIYRASVSWNEALGRFEATLQVPSPDLWWPHTHGEPALYNIALEINRGEEASGEETIELGHVGFRTIHIDTANDNFKVFVNQVPVFCRGACWTPLDVVSLSNDAAKLESTFDLLCNSGMNMLRVGGTMVYEDDAFLNACDTRGILLWQDLMFANMDYPDSDASFLGNVQIELQQQLQRLSSRPSLALVCGNSEGEQQAAMFGATRDRWQPKLFHEIIPAWIAEHSPDVAYWPSSAHGGAFPHQNNAGTTSYYGVGAYLRALDDARRSEVRFASECLAFANVPEEATLATMPSGANIKVHHPQWKARVPRDLGAGWDFDDVRDHYLSLLFGKSALDIRYGDHERYLELSRIAVGEVMAASFAEWRRKRSVCNGALIWFWRDFWPGAGWGIVDSQGLPKSAYYYLKRVLQPIAVHMSDEGCNGVYLHAINETDQALNATLSVALYRHGENLVTRRERNLKIGARDALEVPLIEWFDGFMDLSYAYRFGPPSHDLIVAELKDQRGLALTDAFFFQHSAAIEADLGLTATARKLDGDDIELEICSRRFARAVTVQCEGFVADDQYFHVAPGSSRRIVLRRSGAQEQVIGTVRASNASHTIKIGTAT